MFDHVSIGVADIRRAKAFYDAALKPLGSCALSDGESSLGYGRDAVGLWITVAERPVAADVDSGLHFCFAAPTLAASRISTQRRWRQAARTTAGRACEPTTGRTISPPMSSTRTATAWRPIARPSEPEPAQLTALLAPRCSLLYDRRASAAGSRDAQL